MWVVCEFTWWSLLHVHEDQCTFKHRFKYCATFCEGCMVDLAQKYVQENVEMNLFVFPRTQQRS